MMIGTASESEQADRTSLSQHVISRFADLLKSKMYQTLTFKDLSFDTYRFLLAIVLMVNLVFLSLQVIRFGILMMDHSLGKDQGLSLVIIGFILTSFNIMHLLKLMIAPTPGYAVWCMGIILVQEVIFVAETVLYYGIVEGMDYIIAVSALFLFLQLISVVVVYRFWELILFNYDDSTWDANGSPSLGGTEMDSQNNNRKSTGAPGIKSPVHSEPEV